LAIFALSIHPLLALRTDAHQRWVASHVHLLSSSALRLLRQDAAQDGLAIPSESPRVAHLWSIWLKRRGCSLS